MSNLAEQHKRAVKRLGVYSLLCAVTACLLLLKPLGGFWQQEFFLAGSILTKQVIIVLTSLFFLVVGLGLLMQQKLAWYAFLAWLALGTLWVIVGALLGMFPPIAEGRISGLLFSVMMLLVSVTIITVIYRRTRLAF